ncbi:MAG TPA: FAD-dependent oxidoreductase [Chthonomonadaceae bacterium]|nr:FAD-dependent oxidoreductase [Chthonomonadaceae bacterium]
MTEATHPQFPHIFRPLTLKNVTLRNRIAISGHIAGWWVDQGLPSDAFVAYVEERAKGGIGLFVIGATVPERGHNCLVNVDDRIIPRYRALAEAGHRHGAAVFAQLFHPGYFPLPGPPITDDVPTAPKIHPVREEGPRHEMSVEEIRQMVAAFGAAAGRAAAGGVDGVELHAHEFFLHAQFLNQHWNTRTDEYGGSLENRMRFVVETLQAMRAAIGPDMALGVRLKADDVAQRGMGPDEYRELAQRIEALGLVDYISLTAGDGRFHHGPMPRPEGEWLPLVKELRAVTRLPVMHAGRISTPEMAERALAEGAVDVVCMTKTHIADPHFTRKVFEGRLDDIRYCTRCMQGCHGRAFALSCVYNPVTSREATWAELQPAAKRRRVVVVGAGPAGMECALTAALRGHEVLVLEKADRVGGQVWLGASSPLRKPWARIAEFYQRQSRKGLFEVRLNTEATVESVLALKPEVVVIATGSVPTRLDVAGDGPSALTVHEVLNGAADGAKHVVLFDLEAFSRPLVAADYLSARGISLDFVTSLLTVGSSMDRYMLDELLANLKERGVRFWPGQEIAGWDDATHLRLRDVQTAEEQVLEGVDAVVGTVGSKSVATLAPALRKAVPELYVIGDANLPQTVQHATYQGGRIGRLL